MDDTQTQIYVDIHRVVASRLGKGRDKETGIPKINMISHRRLSLALFNPGLDVLYRVSDTGVANLEKWYEASNDHSDTYYFYMTWPAS